MKSIAKGMGISAKKSLVLIEASKGGLWVGQSAYWKNDRGIRPTIFKKHIFFYFFAQSTPRPPKSTQSDPQLTQSRPPSNWFPNDPKNRKKCNFYPFSQKWAKTRNFPLIFMNPKNTQKLALFLHISTISNHTIGKIDCWAFPVLHIEDYRIRSMS